MILIRKIIYWTLIALATCLPLSCIANIYANPIKTLTLKDAIFLALRFNPNIQSSELERVVQKFSLRQAENVFELQYALTGNLNIVRDKSNGLLSHSQNYNATPNVSIKTDTGTQINLAANHISDGQFYNPGVVLTVNQPLIQGANPNVVLAPLRNAYDQEIINKILLKDNIISTIVTVIFNYRSVINAELSLVIDKQSLQRAEQNYSDTEKFIQAGQMPRMNLAQAKLTVTQSRIAILNDENNLATAKQTLLLSLGLDPSMNITIPTTIPMPKYKMPNRQRSIAIALKYDPTYQQDLLQLRIDQRNLLVAKDSAKWQLNAVGTATWGNGSGGPPNNDFESIGNGTNTTQSIALQLTVPINDLNTQGAIVSAQVSLRQQAIATILQRDTVVSNVINGIRTLETQRLSLEAAIEAESLQEMNLQNSYKQFKAGQLDSLSVSQQQVALTQAQQSVLTSKINYLNSITQFGQLLQQTLNEWNIKIRY